MRQGLRAGDVRIEQQRATTARATRRPEYNFYGTALQSYRLIPAVFCPVLAGDTVATMSFQCRAILGTQAANWVTGAWFESWCFFVRIGDMADAENIRDLLIDPAQSAVIDWRTQCMSSIWNAYFKDEGESVTWSLSNRLRNTRTGWWDSSRDETDLPDVSGAGGDEWQEQWIRYQAMRRAKLTTKTWEEYLGAQGVNVPPQLRVEHDPEQKVPELIQYSREFVYPQLSFGADSSTPSQTWQWFINESLKRSRFCAEPGFFVNCLAVREKRYVLSRDSLGGATSTSGAEFDPLSMLNAAVGWQPIDLDTDPHAALVAIPGEYFGGSDDYIVDSRDLLLFGQDEHQADVTRNDWGHDTIMPPYTVMEPETGSRPTTGMSFTCDARAKYGIKSRVNKDVTR